MSEPWLEELENPPRARRGCGCSRRVKLVLLAIVVGLVMLCFLGNIIVERYHQRQAMLDQLERRERMPPPPVVVPPSGRSTPVKPPPGG